MKHWKSEQTQEMHNAGINLIDGDMDRTLSIAKTDSGLIHIREGCDGHFRKECSKDEAIEALQEAIEWLKSIG